MTVDAVSPASRARAKAVAEGRLHLIADVTFGGGRVTSCTTCDFRCSGVTDEDMAERWDKHVHAMKAARRTEARAALGRPQRATSAESAEVAADEPDLAALSA